MSTTTETVGEEMTSESPPPSRWQTIKPGLISAFRVMMVIVWAVICLYGVVINVPNYTDNAHHSGLERTFIYKDIDGFTVVSDSPVTMQIGKYENPFTFLNRDDGTIAQGIVVSTTVQNVTGHVTYQFGPQVVSQGRWNRVNGDDYDNTPDITLTSDSVMTITTYPGGSAWWVWTKGFIYGFLIWLAGILLANIGEWFLHLIFRNLGRLRQRVGLAS